MAQSPNNNNRPRMPLQPLPILPHRRIQQSQDEIYMSYRLRHLNSQLMQLTQNRPPSPTQEQGGPLQGENVENEDPESNYEESGDSDTTFYDSDDYNDNSRPNSPEIPEPQRVPPLRIRLPAPVQTENVLSGTEYDALVRHPPPLSGTEFDHRPPTSNPQTQNEPLDLTPLPVDVPTLPVDLTPLPIELSSVLINPPPPPPPLPMDGDLAVESEPRKQPNASGETLGVSGDELFRKLSEVIECPVCLQMLRPKTTTLGRCEAGHICCEACAKTIISNVTNRGRCPLCRSEQMRLVNRDVFTFSVIDVLTSNTEYKCKYDTCIARRVGERILGHEKFCIEKPYLCPKRNCNKATPYYTFANGTHDCLNLVRPVLYRDSWTPNYYTNVWKFVVVLSDIFSYDVSNENVSVVFKPTLILPSSDEGQSQSAGVEVDYSMHYKMFLQIMESSSGGIAMYISSFDTRENSDKRMRDKQFSLSAYLHSYTGVIGHAAKLKPVYPGMVIRRTDEALFISKENLSDFVFFTSNPGKVICTKCSLSENPLPHLHLELKERKGRFNLEDAIAKND